MTPKHFFSPLSLLAGVLFGFAGCCLLGRWVSHNCAFPNFRGLTFKQQPVLLFYPTAAQLRETALEQPRIKVLVVIGGNSVLAGHGVPAKEMWSRTLKDLLGPEYRVMDFAGPNGGPIDNGAVVAMMLLKEHRKVICITNGWPNNYGPEGISPSWGYLYWDAYYKGFFNVEPQRLKKIESSWTDHDALTKTKTHAWMNSRLYFDDLWSHAAYQYFFTLWEPLSSPQNFYPRGVLIDHPLENIGSPAEERLDAATRKDMMQKFQESVEQMTKNPSTDKFSPQEMAPPELKDHFLYVLSYFNPYFYRQLPSEELKAYEESYRKAEKDLNAAGIRTVIEGSDFDTGDFFDLVHLNVSGQDKLAAMMAPRVREMAARLGYLKHRSD